MPILDLQRRLRQLGEIRIGHVVDTGRKNKEGKAIKRPAKLDKFRFTSPSRPILEQVAALYGGEVRAWTPANGGPQEWEVYSTSDRLPILIPPQGAVSQWYELYKGSKCVRRCDGVTEQKTDRSCFCDPTNRQCAITTRVNVMLRDVPALGQWLLISKGFYAAVTLPDAAELLAQVGGYVPGWLGMEEKVVQRDEGPARFMVPVIDVDVTPAQLMSGQVPGLEAGSKPAAVAAPERAAIEAAPSSPQQGRPAGPSKDFVALARAAKTATEVNSLIAEAKAEGAPERYLAELTSIGAAKARDDGGLQEALGNPGDYGEMSPRQVAEAEAAVLRRAVAEEQDEVIDLEPVDEDDQAPVGDPTAVWFQIVGAAGGLGWSTDRLEQEFARRNQGLMPGSAEVGQLKAFLTALQGGEVR